MKHDLAMQYKTKIRDLFHIRLVYYLNRLSLIMGEQVMHEHHGGAGFCGNAGIWRYSVNRVTFRWVAGWVGDSFAVNIVLARLARALAESDYTELSGLESDNLLEEVEQYIADYREATRADHIPLFSGYIDAQSGQL